MGTSTLRAGRTRTASITGYPLQTARAAAAVVWIPIIDAGAPSCEPPWTRATRGGAGNRRATA